jgi:hypothetical protein
LPDDWNDELRLQRTFRLLVAFLVLQGDANEQHEEKKIFDDEQAFREMA